MEFLPGTLLRSIPADLRGLISQHHTDILISLPISAEEANCLLSIHSHITCFKFDTNSVSSVTFHKRDEQALKMGDISYGLPEKVWECITSCSLYVTPTQTFCTLDLMDTNMLLDRRVGKVHGKVAMINFLDALMQRLSACPDILERYLNVCLHAYRIPKHLEDCKGERITVDYIKMVLDSIA